MAGKKKDPKKTYSPNYGGPRPNQGHRHLDGSLPGQGEYLTRKTVTLPDEMIAFLVGLGEGNLSKGIRLVTEDYQNRRG